MSLDRRRMGESSPTASFSPNQELIVTTTDGGVIANVKVTGRIRDHSIQVTDSTGGKGKITFVGREVRYYEIHDRVEKMFRPVCIVQE